MAQLNIPQEIAKLDELRGALLAQQAQMSAQDRIRALEAAQPKVKPGTPEAETLLATGYGFGLDEAKRIIKERDENPATWPLEEYRKAKAFLEAFKAQSRPISPRPAWHRTQ